MKRIIRGVSAACLVLSFGLEVSVYAADIFVSKEKGDNQNFNLNEWLKLDHNILFLNKQVPLLYVEPGKSAAGKMERQGGAQKPK